MSRLTERDEYGNANIIGVDSQDLQLNLEYDQFDDVTSALNRLADFEDMCFDKSGKQVLQAYRLRELAEAERENRLKVFKHPNCYGCQMLLKTNIWMDDEPCKSCRERALAATEPKGEAT